MAEGTGVKRSATGATKKLHEMVDRAGDARAFLNRVIYPMYQNMQRERWMTENVSETGKWPALNSRYASYKLRKFGSFPGGGRKMMIATNKLFNSVVGGDGGSAPQGHNKIVTKSELKIFTTVTYAAHANDIRPFAKFSRGSIREIQAAIGKYLRGRK